MKMLVVLALAAVACAEPEADAQIVAAVPSVYSAPVAAAPALTYSAATPVVSSYNVPAVTYNTAAAVPAVTYNTAAVAAAVPAVTYKAAPVVTYSAAATPVVAATHAATITNYNNPSQYTAVEHTPFGPKHVAKNGPVVHVAKREAEPQILTTYNAALPYVYNRAAVAYNTPLAYSAPVVAAPAVASTITNYNNPSQYTAVENTPFGSRYVAKNGPVVHVAKREAEPQILTALNTAAVYSAPVATYNSAVVAPAVAATYAAPYVTGVHPSNFGICRNNMGVQVPC